MLTNRAKKIMREGGLAIGTYCGPFADPTIVELIGLAGLDAAFIDMEHQALDLRDVRGMVVAAERVGITPLVRTPGLDAGLILRLLDLGVQGIQVPHISGAAGARAAIEAVRYVPMGDRGMLGSSRAADYGRVAMRDHMEASNREILLAVMIEDLAALDEIDAIAALEGIDLIAIGPADLSRALGVPGQAEHPKLVAAIERISAAVKKGGHARLGLPLGNPLFPRTPKQMLDLGVGYSNLNPSPEVRLLESLTEHAQAVRGQM